MVLFSPSRRHDMPGIAVHTDAAQSIGKVRVRVDELGVDMLSVCAHKLYAPKGAFSHPIRRWRPGYRSPGT